jgi:hypothetical protein
MHACSQRGANMMHRLLWSIACVLAIAAPLHAQQQHTADGRVVRLAKGPTNDSTVRIPLAGVMVTLHRVGKDAAGPVDSLKTKADGRFHFAWTPTGAADAMYFASVSYAGIAYFSAPLRAVVNAGADADISVFDTTSRPIPMTVRGRHLVVSKVDSLDQRTVVEVFELGNDSFRTRVAAPKQQAAPTWAVAIPQAARDVRSGDGEIAADAFRQSPGRVSIFAPIAPGIKQLSFSYRVPASSFPLPFVMQYGASELEVLIEEPQGVATGARLAPVAPVTIEGRKLRRFLAQDVSPDAPVTLDLPSGRTLDRSVYFATVLAAIGVAMLLLLLRVMQRRRPLGLAVPASTHPVDVPLADRLAREIADLDRVFASQRAPSDAVQSAYHNRRAELKDALAAELARARTA